MTKEELQALRGRVLQAKTSGQNVANLENYISQLEGDVGELDKGHKLDDDQKGSADHLLALIFKALHPNAKKSSQKQWESQEIEDDKAAEAGAASKESAITGASSEDQLAAHVASHGDQSGGVTTNNSTLMSAAGGPARAGVSPPFSIPDADAHREATGAVPARASIFPAFTVPDADHARSGLSADVPLAPRTTVSGPAPGIAGPNLPSGGEASGLVGGTVNPFTQGTHREAWDNEKKAGAAKAKDAAEKAAKKVKDAADSDSDDDEYKSMVSKAVDKVKSVFKSDDKDEDDSDSDEKSGSKVVDGVVYDTSHDVRTVDAARDARTAHHDAKSDDSDKDESTLSKVVDSVASMFKSDDEDSDKDSDKDDSDEDDSKDSKKSSKKDKDSK